ncbi:MAG: 50S ribosomal protein L13 [Myxococcota bacterium]
MQRTYMAKPGEVDKQWHLVDASGRTLGRLASRVAAVLRGKHTPRFTPHVDVGDFVVVINADKVVLTGRKEQRKLYRQHSQYPGGLTTFTAAQVRQRHPENLVKLAVKRMLPNTPLGRVIFKKLKVYASPEHPHAAQNPTPLAL